MEACVCWHCDPVRNLWGPRLQDTVPLLLAWLPHALDLRRSRFSDGPSPREFPRRGHRCREAVRETQQRGVPVTFWGTALSVSILGSGHRVWLTSSRDRDDQNACRPPRRRRPACVSPPRESRNSSDESLLCSEVSYPVTGGWRRRNRRPP